MALCYDVSGWLCALCFPFRFGFCLFHQAQNPIFRPDFRYFDTMHPAISEVSNAISKVCEPLQASVGSALASFLWLFRSFLWLFRSFLSGSFRWYLLYSVLYIHFCGPCPALLGSFTLFSSPSLLSPGISLFMVDLWGHQPHWSGPQPLSMAQGC